MAGVRIAAVCGVAMCIGGPAVAKPVQLVKVPPVLPQFWQAQGCKHGHPSSVAYREVRRIMRLARPSGRRVRHYVRCVASVPKFRALRRLHRVERKRRAKGARLRAMIAEANRIDRARHHYVLGGGHGSFRGPYDCSGAVSAVLWAGGFLRRPMVSGAFTRWGRRGRGAVTIYANAGHVYMTIRGRAFGTSRANPGGGAGWFRGGARPGYSVVHVPLRY